MSPECYAPRVRLLRGADSGRVRASVRALAVAVGTLAAFVGAGNLLATVVESAETASVAGGLLSLLAQSALYVALVVGAIWAGSRLERRPVTTFGLAIDGRWLRDFAAGVAASLLGITVSVWWGGLQGTRTVHLAAGVPTAPEGALAVLAVLAAYLVFSLLGNVYEEVVYRRIVLGNFAEGLAARGVRPAVAVAAATVGSLALFGAYHVPLRGNVVVAVDAALVGVTFAVPYLLTGDLALSVGVHFGRVVTVFESGATIAGVDVPAVVDVTRDTLAANLSVLLVEIAAVCLVVFAWVYATRGEFRLAATVWDPGVDE
jgi:membrane protease YdiL (CAAX protease family)